MPSFVSTAAPSIGAVLSEAAALAREFEDMPLFYAIKQVREGAITLQQQAERFATAQDDETRADAATWAREGYQLLSAGLPDTHLGAVPDEGKTGWQTAAQISQLFGGESLWNARVQLAFMPSRPDATRHNPDPEYLRALIALTGLSQQKVADEIGIGHRLLKYYLTTPAPDKESRVATYPVQYAIERLAVTLCDTPNTRNVGSP